MCGCDVPLPPGCRLEVHVDGISRSWRVLDAEGKPIGEPTDLIRASLHAWMGYAKQLEEKVQEFEDRELLNHADW